MIRTRYAVELVFDEDDGLVKGSAVIGLAFEAEDGTIMVDLRAVPMAGEPLRLTPLPDVSERFIKAAAKEYREARARGGR